MSANTSTRFLIPAAPTIEEVLFRIAESAFPERTFVRVHGPKRPDPRHFRCIVSRLHKGGWDVCAVPNNAYVLPISEWPSVIRYEAVTARDLEELQAAINYRKARMHRLSGTGQDASGAA
jgi:hypothetical protein